MRTNAFLLAAVGLALAAPMPLRAQAATRNPHGAKVAECTDCHRPDRWTPLAKPTRFQHGSTGFTLEEAHARVACRSCHQSLVFSRVGVTCLDCHKDAHAGELGVQCQSCHTTRSWNVQNEVFRTHGRTRFPLFAAHASLDCAACHRGQKPWEYANTPIDCAPCHTATFDQTTSPRHVATGFSRECLQCHSNLARDWRAPNWQHPDSYRLTGAHARAACASCHANGYKGTTRQCVGCHRPDYQKTTNPNHVAGRFATECQNCHSTTGWRPAGFDHSKGRFPLTGAHAGVDCTECHVGGRYAGTPTDCYSCHKANYDKTSNPNHSAAGFPTVCASCHSTTAWQPASFDHGKTRFPLTGAHVGVSCAKCHVGGKYAGTPSDCYSCHKADYDKTTSPNHSAAGFPTSCQNCHTTTIWKPANFDHNKTGFPLTGAHTSVNCSQCHVGGKYAGTPTDCYSCHKANYDKTSNPNHSAAGFPTSCASCHTTKAWTPASFDHGKTKFPLTGAHTSVSCAKCHVGGRFTGTPTDCFACHKPDYDKTTNPNHSASGFPTACASCHSTKAWTPATFDHSKTKFPLTGAHTSVSCTKCHAGGKYTGTPTDCYACHKADYDGASNPSHAGFPTACTNCHTTKAWKPASFDHSKTRFPLTGAHVRVDCAKCHPGGRYTGTPRDCYSCHKADYDGTTNPNHKAANFPTTCQNCHTTSGWSGASFNHDGFFPINSGAHRGAWSSCQDCHTNPNNYAVFSCLNCHAHNQSDMNSKHKGVNGYSYESSACYRCHPRGSAGGNLTFKRWRRDVR